MICKHQVRENVLLDFELVEIWNTLYFPSRNDRDSAYNTFKFFKSRYETISFALGNRILVVISLVRKYLSLFASLSLLLFIFNVLLVTAATNDDITHILTSLLLSILDRNGISTAIY